jgi:hypothetical protein
VRESWGWPAVRQALRLREKLEKTEFSRKDAKYRKERKEENLGFLGVLAVTLRLCEKCLFFRGFGGIPAHVNSVRIGDFRELLFGTVLHRQDG